VKNFLERVLRSGGNRCTLVGMSVSPGELVERRLIGLCSHLNTLHAQLVDETIILLRTGAWTDYWGYRSLNQWLTIKAGLSRGTATDVIRVAKAADTHPTLVGLFRAARLTLDQVAAAVRVDARFEAQVAQMAPFATVTQIRRLVRSAALSTADPDVTPDPAPEPVTVFFKDHDRDLVELHASLPGDGGRVLEQALLEARDALFQAGHMKVTWTDALVEMAQRSLDSVTTPARRDRFRVHLHVNTDPAVDGQMETATWADGQAMPDAIRDLIVCDGTVIPEWWRDGKPYAQGRQKRVVPDWMRHHITHRDRGCRVPGCTAERWVDIHHIVHWNPPHNGPTEPGNLVSLCRHHHRMHHHGDLHIAGDPEQPDGLTFTNSRGRPIGPAPPPPPGPLPDPAGRYRPPTGERLHTDRILWNPNSKPLFQDDTRAS
jgi:hypothetical protein